MSRPRFEVADLIRAYGATLLERHGATLTPEQRRVLHDLPRCRTAALGGHVEACDRCGHQRIAYNSCRNRHCPKCQASAAAAWVEARAAELLPVPYFHVVFTLPRELNGLALSHPRVVYDLLLRASAATLRQVAADPRHLDARIGVLAILHTWGQNLQLHPHVHCVVPGGGLSPDGTRFLTGRRNFFLPVRVLGRVFRGRFLQALEDAFRRGRLTRSGVPRGADSWQPVLRQAARRDWVVYARPPFGGPVRVLKYLARYTHRVAISNRRLLTLEQGRVRFRWKDYAHGGRRRVLSLDAVEFLRRFLMHVLPSGFVRIRSSGLLANRDRQAKLQRCRTLLAGSAVAVADRSSPGCPAAVEPVRSSARSVCPVCGVGRMVTMAVWERQRPAPRPAAGWPTTAVVTFDTS